MKAQDSTGSELSNILLALLLLWNKNFFFLSELLCCAMGRRVVGVGKCDALSREMRRTSYSRFSVVALCVVCHGIASPIANYVSHHSDGQH